MKPDRKKAWISWTVWLVVILILARTMKGEKIVGVTVESDGLSFETDSGYAAQLKWDDIKSLEIREKFSYGTLVEGVDGKKEKSGIWSSEEFGEYELFSNAKLECCIICQRESGPVIVFNFESEESTQSLYEAIVKELNK